jgi:PAS domain S-box-containing protein
MSKKELLEENILLKQRIQELEQSETNANKAEDALKKSDDLFKIMFEGHSAIMLLVDPLSGNILDANAASVKFYGYSRSKLLSMDIDEINMLNPELIKKAREHVLLKDLCCFIFPHKLANGEIRTVEVHSSPILVKDRQILFSIIHDITNRKKAKDALRKLEAKQNAMISNISDVIGIVDTEGILKHVSPNSEKWFGWDPRSLIGKDGFSLVHSDDLKHIQEEFFKILEKDNSSTTVEFHHKCSDGSYKPIELTATNLTANPAIAGILLNYHDITERRKAEIELSEKKALFEAIFNCIPDAIVYTNIDREVIGINRAFTSIFGFTYDDLKGDKTSFFYESLEEFQRQGKIRFNLTAAEPALPYEVTYRRKDGSIFPGETLGTVIKNASGTTIGYIGVIRDITERKKAEEEQEKLQEQLTQSQKMESVGRLAGGVAHDFNNMLGVILGHTDMILEDLDATLPICDDLKEIRQAAVRSAGLTRQLLAFARRQTVTPKVLDLNETLEEMLQMLRRLIGEDIDLIWLPGKDLGPVKIDPSQIDQMLANLLVNARDAITDVGNVTIETSSAFFDEDYCSDHPYLTAGEFVLLAVSDDGCGMNKETLAQVFEPFFTTKEQGKGTGLGLATTYGIVRQNNGFIDVVSEPAIGTTFKIYLPRYFAKEEQILKVASAKPDIRGNETILLVEDEPSILRMTTTMLKRLGYTVVAAATPGDAIRLAKEHAGSIDLLMTDVVMPEMNGRDLTKSILLSYPDIKRLFMSGYTADVIAHHGVLDEGVHFLQKPFSKNELSIKVHEILEKL